jgi:hypothetical protein
LRVIIALPASPVGARAYPAPITGSSAPPGIAADAGVRFARQTRLAALLDMKILLKLLLLAAIGLPLAALVAVWMCFQDAPLVARKAEISAADIERGKRILQKHDPRWARAGSVRILVASQQDVDLALNYAASQLHQGSARVVLLPGLAEIQASLELPRSPFGAWLNIDTTLRQRTGLPAVDRLRIGGLPVPGFIADLALARLVTHFNQTSDGRAASDVVKSVAFAANQLQVVYAWRDDIPDRMRAALLPPTDQERLKAYSDRLAEWVDLHAAQRSISLAQLMPPMFELARARAAGGDAARENRAVLAVLALYANGVGLSAIIPEAKAWRRPARHQVLLNGRDDSPKHFLVSAVIAAEAGSPLADAIGLYKEVEDSRGGSGFSFNDIAADRAGTRFGQIAVQSAAKLQERLATGATERDFMPDAADLPDFLPEAEFKRRYGGIGAPAYERAMADIEQRLAALPLYQ